MSRVSYSQGQAGPPLPFPNCRLVHKEKLFKGKKFHIDLNIIVRQPQHEFLQ